MGGIGLSCNTTSTGYLTHTHKIRTQYAHNTHTIRTQSCTHMHTQYTHTIHTHNTQIQDTHIHLNNTEYRYNNHAAHTEQNNTGATENNAQPQRTFIHTHSFDFYHLQQYIKKLYNIAIYVFYIFCSPYL